MTLAARLDDFGKPGWIALTVVSFLVFWPIGLLVLGYAIGSGRMGCWGHAVGQRWQERMHEKMDRMQRRMQEKTAGWCGPRQGGGWASGGSSGNWAFDEYRAETLRRLEEEQREFREFLDRLRQAKDKGEFDQFMAERRRRSENPPTTEA